MSENPFTSDLSVDEVVFLDDVGFEPMRLVMATCHWHIGWQWAGWSQNVEMDVLTRSMSLARHGAMQRVEQQLAALNADGIVGVRIEAKHGSQHAEFMVMGTAVRRRDGNGRAWRQPNGAAFTSGLSGQDLGLLLRAGYAPRALVMGNCVYHVAHQGLVRWLSNVGQNVELENYTQALYDARELAMERMQAEAIAAGGEGVVGAHIREGSWSWGSHVIEFFALGTAVASHGELDASVRLYFDLGR